MLPGAKNNKDEKPPIDLEAVGLAEIEVHVSPQIKLALAHAELKRILVTLDPSLRHERMRNGFKKILIDAEALSTISLVTDKIIDDILRTIYRLVDLLTVEMASADMIANDIQVAGQAIADLDEQKKAARTSQELPSQGDPTGGNDA